MILVHIQARFNDNGLLAETNYWNSEVCQKGYYYLIHHQGNYFLLVPENNDLLQEITGTETIVITKGNYKGKDNWFEIMFEDNSDCPYMILMENEQVSRITPLKEGWIGNFYIYTGSLEKPDYHSDKVHYRITDNLPCLQPVETQ